MEHQEATFSCQLSKAGASVKWLKNGEELTSGDKYEISSADACCTLKVRDATVDESAEYTVVAGDVSAKATLTVDRECFLFFFVYATAVLMFRLAHVTVTLNIY